MHFLSRWGKAIAAHSRLVLILGVIGTVGLYALAMLGVNGENLFDRTKTGPPDTVGSESYYVSTVRQDLDNHSEATKLGIYVQSVNTADPVMVESFGSLAVELSKLAHVDTVTSPYGAATAGQPTPVPAPVLAGLIDRQREGFVIDVRFTETYDNADHLLSAQRAVESAAEEWVARVATERGIAPAPTVLTMSSALVVNDFETQIEHDLITGEAIALPAALLVMVLVFGGFLAAATPIAGAMASIAGGLATLYGMTFLFNVDNAAINVVTVLGIGLSVDYGLLVVSRFREELATGGPDVLAHREVALQNTLATAGRTVLFSGIIVGVSVGGMLLFSPEMVRSFGAAALGVVATAIVTSLTVVPALAYIWARRIGRSSVLARLPLMGRVVAATSDVEHEDGRFARLAAWTQKRPWLVMVGVTGVLLVIAAPFTSLQLRFSELEMLPVDNERRLYLESLYDGFPQAQDPPIIIATQTSPQEAQAWGAEIAKLDGVVAVQPPWEEAGHTFMGVRLEAADHGSAQAIAVVSEIRALDAPFPVWVGGLAATQKDFNDAIIAGAPLSIGLVVLVTLTLLFLMTGSVLVPLKTLVINALSLSATMGFVVWAFQDGHLEGLLNFQSPGGIEAYVAVLIVAFGFGLAMDYEVFLLARIKEYIDAGYDNDAAVRAGLQRSGRIITSAAVIIMIVFLGFAAGKLVMIKEIGVGLAFAVLLDATVVRMLLVPATMTVLGPWNWWAPAPLKRWHARHSLAH